MFGKLKTFYLKFDTIVMVINMYKVLKNINLTESIYLMEVMAPLVVNNAMPGEFVIVMTYEDSERIPLTIVDYNKDSGVLTLVYQVVGASTLELSKEHSELFSVVGPLGNKSLILDSIDNNKKILFVGGGVGIAPIIPQVKYLLSHGIKTDCIYGTKTKDSIIFESELKNLVNNLFIMTDDGSYGEKGFVTEKLESIIDNYDIVIAIGPIIMMKYVSEIAVKHHKEIIVSMNPIMVDGSGMCGACRLMVDGHIKFACVDGPEFDGSKVDFDAALKRMNIYKTEEGRNYLKMIEGDTHEGGCSHE